MSFFFFEREYLGIFGPRDFTESTLFAFSHAMRTFMPKVLLFTYGMVVLLLAQETSSIKWNISQEAKFRWFALSPQPVTELWFFWWEGVLIREYLMTY